MPDSFKNKNFKKNKVGMSDRWCVGSWMCFLYNTTRCKTSQPISDLFWVSQVSFLPTQRYKQLELLLFIGTHGSNCVTNHLTLLSVYWCVVLCRSYDFLQNIQSSTFLCFYCVWVHAYLHPQPPSNSMWCCVRVCLYMNALYVYVE